MSWTHRRSFQQNMTGSQHEAMSPLPAPCSLSQASQSSAGRTLGVDITNRSPTPPPPLPPQPPSTQLKLARCLSTSPASRALIWSTKQYVLYSDSRGRSENVLLSTDDNTEPALPIVLTSHDTLFNAMGGVQKSADRYSLHSTRRRSRSSTMHKIDIVQITDRFACDGAHNQWRDSEDVNVSGTYSPDQCDTEVSNESTSADLQPQKRARLQSSAIASIASPVLSPCKLRNGQNNTYTMSDWIFPEKQGGQPVSGEGESSSVFFTPISSNLLLTRPVTDDGSAPKLAQSTVLKNDSSSLSDEQQTNVVQPEQQVTLAKSSPPSLSGPRRGLAQLCMPARLLDAELPSWQVLTATSSNTGGPGGLLSSTPEGDRSVCIVNAVDSTVVYSPSSLEDISPILGLTEDRAVRCGSRGVLGHHQRTPLDLQNEEAVCREKESHGSGDAFTGRLAVVHALFPQTHIEDEDGDEEIYNSTIPSVCEEKVVVDDAHLTLRDDALDLASDTFEELQCSLLRWQQ